MNCDKYRKLLIVVAGMFFVICFACGCTLTMSDWRTNKNQPSTFEEGLSNGDIEKIDFVYHNLKILSAKFFSYMNHNLIIAGSEIPKNVYNENSGVIFVYDITDSTMIACEQIDGLASVTSIYECGNSFFLGGICSSNTDGCYLYKYVKGEKTIEEIEHFEGRGIWALTGDDKDKLFISTSDPIALYNYDIRSGKVKIIAEKFTAEAFARSISYMNGYCYLGMGTQAELLKIDVEDGTYTQILPEKYEDDTFVYAQSVLAENIYLLLSPSYKIVKFQPENMEFVDTGYFYDPSWDIGSEGGGAGKNISLLGNIFYVDGDGNPIRQEQYGTIASVTDGDVCIGIDTSGILHQVTNEQDDDLFESINVSGIVPNHYFVYGGKLIVPERRFVSYDLTKELQSVFLVKDEPQAVGYNGDGVFTANYTECTLYYYPWEVLGSKSYSVDLSDKKFMLADIEEQCRPHDLMVTEDKLLLASGPLYGKFGGAISCYDLNEKRLLYTDINIIENQNVASFGKSDMENMIWAGTSCYGENTTPAFVDEPAHLFLWNYEKEDIVLDIVPEENNLSVGSIVENDGIVYCILRYGRLLAFDSITGENVFSDESQVKFRQIFENSQGAVLAVSEDTIWKIEDDFHIYPIITGFENLSNMTEDIVEKNLYIYDDDSLYMIKESMIRGLTR